MRRRRLQAVILCAVLHLAFNSGNALGLVLCSNSTGHVAIETAGGQACCDDRDALPAVADVHSGDRCDCIDTPIVQTLLEPRARGDKPQPPRLEAAPLPIAHASLSRPMPASLQDHLPPRAGPAQQDLALRRTIVLLV